MTTVLVTGATGTLGTPTVARLRAAGHEIRALSRRRAPGLVTGDLLTGAGLEQALEDAGTVLHLSTAQSHKDVAATRTLLTAASAAGVGHVVLISIVGIESVPIGYYKDKVTIERLVAESTLPYTVLRATQFHSLVASVFGAQRFSPVLLAPAVPLQPVAVEEVADRLAELAEGPAAGRVADIAGPEQLRMTELAHQWRSAKGSRRPVVPLRLPGKIFGGYAGGGVLVPGPAYGRISFAEYLAGR